MAYTRENKILYLPSKRHFAIIFTNIFHDSLKSKANFSLLKHFKETVHLLKVFEMPFLTFLIFPMS